MKVALLSDCYLPRLGGIEVQVHDLAVRLRGRGHQVSVFTATPGQHGERGGFVDVVDGIEVHRLALRLPFELPVNPLAPPELRRRLEQGGYDVAHVHMGVVSPFAVDCARVTTSIGLPTTMTWHCMLGAAAPLFRLVPTVRGWAEAGVAMNAVSGVAGEPLQRAIGDAGVVENLPNGIDVSAWLTERGPQAGAHGIRVVSAMRLAARKRPMALLHEVLRVRELAPDVPFTLEVLGEGPDRARLQRFVDRHDLAGTVRLVGRVSREELRRTYADADIYVAPARLESFGIAALEARTAGLPVVGLWGSGLNEYVEDGVNGFLAGDDEALAGCVARLLLDDALRRRMAEHNRQVPPAQSWEHVLGRAEAEYARAIALAGARR
ncbi:MAG TPA: glycosyltransferase family 4 protein [Oryzihumus sp.]|nr:glycosyltransferase family 4 protein [Oryzihumus sp.]